MTQLGMAFQEWKIELPVSALLEKGLSFSIFLLKECFDTRYVPTWFLIIRKVRPSEMNFPNLFFSAVSADFPAVWSCRCWLNAEETLKAVLRASLQLQGRLSDVYPALKAPGLAAGMAASALNLSGLGVMNRSVVFFNSVSHILPFIVSFVQCLGFSGIYWWHCKLQPMKYPSPHLCEKVWSVDIKYWK